MPEGTHVVSVTVNGRSRTDAIESRLTLADWLRDHLDLTGTKLGCEHGVCGACTLFLDDHPALACTTLAVACNGRSVRTIEDFDRDTLMIMLRRAFNEEHALQCGFCTPGMLLFAHDLVRRMQDDDQAPIRRELRGNLCRCTGYAGIVQAIRRVIRERATDKEDQSIETKK
jgi:aerobic carbon-monoxide dehydrogenase small subunit